jgi:O-antigen/teichoic acid export membrane protein
MLIKFEILKKRLSGELKTNLKKLRYRNSFIRNSFTLTAGTIISQAIPVLFSPILTRLFTPDEFGLLAIITSITAILSVISTGKYESAILIAKDDFDAATLALLSLILSFCFSILAVVFLLFYSLEIIQILNQPRIEYLIFFCPLISFFISIYQIYNEWTIKTNRFLTLSFNKMYNSGAITLSNLYFGLINFLNGGLILGEVIGRFLTSIICIGKVLKYDFGIFKSIKVWNLRKMLKCYSNCPRFILPAQLLNTLGAQLTILLISSLFNESELGYFSMTILVLSVPTSIISNAIRDVFKQKANEEFKKKKNCRTLFYRTVRAISILSIVIFSLLYIVLPDLFALVFGNNWRIAGEYARVLTPMVMISFISESVLGMFIVAEKMKALLKWQIIYAVVNVGSLYLGYIITKEMKSALIFYMVGKSLVHLLSLVMSYNFSKGN